MTDYWDQYQEAGARGYVAESVRYAFDADEWSAFPVSAVFETYREAYGLTLSDVSNALKIRVNYLEAIELGDYDSLPGRAFAIGYVRSIAEFLQLPSDIIVERFKAEAYASMAPSLDRLSILQPPSEKKLSRGLVVLVSICLLVACWGLWMIYRTGFSFGFLLPSVVATSDNQSNPAAQNVLGESRQRVFDQPSPLVLEASGALVEPIAQNSPQDILVAGGTETVFGIPIPKRRPASVPQNRQPTSESQNQPNLPQVEIEAMALAWVQIRDVEGRPVVSKMLQAGQSHFVTAENGLQLSTGSIEALRIKIDGQPVELPRARSDLMVTTLALDAASLQSLGVAN